MCSFCFQASANTGIPSSFCPCTRSSVIDQTYRASKPRKLHFDNHHSTTETAFGKSNSNFGTSKIGSFKSVIHMTSSLVKSTSPLNQVKPPRSIQSYQQVLPPSEIILKNLGPDVETTPNPDPALLLTLNYLFDQQSAMVNLASKEETLEQTLSVLAQELKTIRTNFERKLSNTESKGTQQSSEGKIVATSEMVLNQMYPTNPQFRYFLRAVGDFPTMLCREKPFNLTLELIDLNSGLKVVNQNKIEITLALYTATNPPKPILINTTGEKVFKGDINCELQSGNVNFSKVFANEVSSHYLSGCVFLVAYPKFTGEYVEKMKILATYCGNSMIDPSLIRPWIMDRLVIKAKKLRK